jgi:hypothetical protein
MHPLPVHAHRQAPARPAAGLTGGDRLCLYVHSPDSVKQLLLPPSFVRTFPEMVVRTDLLDMQVGRQYRSSSRIVPPAWLYMRWAGFPVPSCRWTLGAAAWVAPTRGVRWQ